MSVAFLIDFKTPGRDTAYLPVATEGVFGRYWLSTAERLGLFFFPRFISGATFEIDELPAVIAELEAIRDDFAQHRKTVDLLPRVDFLLESLKALDPSEIKEIWCG